MITDLPLLLPAEEPDGLLERVSIPFQIMKNPPFFLLLDLEHKKGGNNSPHALKIICMNI